MVGTLDVDGMLDRLTPEQFDEWIAYRDLEPDRFERLIEILKLGFACLANAWGGKLEPRDFDPLKKDEQDTASPQQAADFVRGVIGGNRNR